ncbi:hypothetical protein [Azotobacter vinelandii]|uniref:hypothetical protein n=1 Tax=Azotobacter vinelandii TaxID=354 RepID=UPI00091FC53B|nr:hypothetical protein [Azotobacter vinelandii]WKN23217.1 hypothetical protein AVAEIV_001254 [Azotobacter vinelandii]SFY07776.1 hypothetical protein SAMN04244547_03879 [Azotobacter vinelandii]
MAKAKAPAITAEQILQAAEFYSAQDLRNLQRELTGTVRELQRLTEGSGLASRIGGLLPREQQDVLRNAAALVGSINYSITHAKESRQRQEKQAAARRKERELQARTLLTEAYPPSTTPEQQVDIIKLALVLHRAGYFWGFYSEIELNQKMRDYVTKVQSSTNTAGVPGAVRSLNSTVDFCRSEILSDLTQHLSIDIGDDLTVQARFDALQQRLAELTPQVLDSRLASETIRIWTEALSEAEQRVGADPLLKAPEGI